MEIIINLLFIAFSLMYIIEKSGIIIDISKFIYVKLNPKKEYMYQIIPKPFSCKNCMVFWISLVYLLTTSLNIYFILFLSSINSSLIVNLFDKIYDKIIILIDKIK